MYIDIYEDEKVLSVDKFPNILDFYDYFFPFMPFDSLISKNIRLGCF